MMVLLACLLVMSGCGGGGSASSGSVFDSAVTNVMVEIDFETGQEPFTGPIARFGDTFDLTIANIDRLFAGTKQLSIPTTLAEMEDVGAIPDEQLTVSDVATLAETYRDQPDTPGTKTYYVLFVSGTFADDSGAQPNVLGVALGGTSVVVMFKDVIRSTDVAAFPNVVRFVEQSTLIHELAHVIGLVDNGVPLSTAHRDEAHGAHCTDDRCVMYYLNEGAADAARFARDSVTTNTTVLFDDRCLADVDALTGEVP